ncbi:PilZ domain-containing protein [Shewanella yunxiaonensis]|uniref:PilZ domain-containing protein n=1 Tax=Shewanella yunxiaonensis TaxID=2829809 RepID=A0ABX7YVD1_9GAMM|nr:MULTISPECIES: PilZ domain-containing protein [Shewanella]MDF0532756.1 PilZ domain-containing protein [Shewanella sp. A32]QUN06644.1 PilZ domain-containing protein [Shewanella yunxiaonensis]
MSADAHSLLIEQLKPIMMEPNFDDLFDKMTQGESNSSRFLLKMEINRLASPCLRIIDLRDKSELPCSEVIFAEQHHYLDEPAKEIFQRALALYRQQYTMGVYEEVMRSHQQRRHQKESNKIEPAPSLVPGIILGNYIRRTEERMNYSIKILVSQPGQREVTGNTLDLSVSGARIRLPAKHGFNLQRPLTVKLQELGDEFYFADLQQGVDYQVVDADVVDDDCRLRLKRVSGSEQLSQMLSDLIRGYKLRYKVDVNDVMVNASGLGFERHYLPHYPHLPLFISYDQQQQPQIGTILLSSDNQELLHYFLDENDVNQLPAILSRQRLQALLAHPNDSAYSLLYCFTYNAKGRLFFYAATLAELQETALLPLFFHYGAGKASWKVCRLHLDDIDHRQPYKSSALPGDDPSYSSMTEQQLAQYQHLVQLMDLTDEAAAEQYQCWQSPQNINDLKRFGIEKGPQSQIHLVALNFSERRREARFAFKTLVSITQDGKQLQAMTHDISSRGLQLHLDNPVVLDNSKELLLSFSKLQQLAPKIKLQDLPYRLVHSRKNGVTLHLAAIVGHIPHTGVEFLNQLIIRNREKLQQLTDNHQQTKELADGLKNQLMRHLHAVPFMLEKTTKSFRMACIGIGMQRDAISDLFAREQGNRLLFDLAPLLAEGRLKLDFIEPIRRMKPEHSADSFELFAIVSTGERPQIITCKRAEEMPTPTALSDFIQQADRIGRFMALKVYRGAVGKPDLSYLQRELDYVKLHAKHRAQQLEQLLWRIVGVGELVDITAEVRMRLPPPAQD